MILVVFVCGRYPALSSGVGEVTSSPEGKGTGCSCRGETESPEDGPAESPVPPNPRPAEISTASERACKTTHDRSNYTTHDAAVNIICIIHNLNGKLMFDWPCFGIAYHFLVLILLCVYIVNSIHIFRTLICQKKSFLVLFVVQVAKKILRTFTEVNFISRVDLEVCELHFSVT